jgi:hypothetical protein
VHVLDTELVKKRNEYPLALVEADTTPELLLLIVLQFGTFPAEHDESVQILLHLTQEFGLDLRSQREDDRLMCRLVSFDYPFIREFHYFLPLYKIITT